MTSVGENTVLPPRVNMELLSDPAAGSVYSEEVKAGSQTDICGTVFIVALFTTAKR